MPSDDPTASLYRALHTDAGADGFFDRIGAQHAAQFTDGADVLLVAFEQTETLLRPSRDGQPIARGVQNRTDIAQLTLLAQSETWFRAPEVYAFFDGLIDDGFFDGFERVIFYGAGAQGYAAAAYSVAAPRAEVVLIQPQASLAPSVAGWDTRFSELRRTDFTSRYGYAPRMMETAARGFVIVDPAEREDFMHACLFARDNVDVIRQRFLGPEAEPHLDALGLIGKLLDVVVAGDATVAEIVQTLRPRRQSYRHLSWVLSAAETCENDWRIARVARAAMAQNDHPRFAAALDTAQAGLAAEGRSLPSLDEVQTPPPDNGTSAAAAVLAVGGALGGLAASQPEAEVEQSEIKVPDEGQAQAPDAEIPDEVPTPEAEQEAVVESNGPISAEQEAELNALVAQIPDPTPREVNLGAPVEDPELVAAVETGPDTEVETALDIPEPAPELISEPSAPELAEDNPPDPTGETPPSKLPFPAEFLVLSGDGPVSAWPGPQSVSLRDHQHPNGGQAAVAMSPAQRTPSSPQADDELAPKSPRALKSSQKNRPKLSQKARAKALRKARPGKRRL